MKPQTIEFDHVIVGSGAAGATVGMILSESGKRVAIVEEGKRLGRPDFKADVFSAIRDLFRGQGMQVAKGRSVIPILEGKCVGGSTVMNGAIVHRLPEKVYVDWSDRIPGLSSKIPFGALEDHATAIEAELEIKRNLGGALGLLPASRALKRLGWSHHAMLRNAPGCQGSGRCLQGCPTGGKWSMENSFIPRAERAGAKVYSSTRALSIVFEGEKAVAVLCECEGKRFLLRARKSIVVACGVTQTPLLLRRSGLGKRLPYVGKNFRMHLGVGIVGRMKQTVRELEGPPQGIEVDQFKARGFKLATQLVPLELLLSRTPMAGEELVAALKSAKNYSSWMASIPSMADGTVSAGLWGDSSIKIEPTPEDLGRTRESLYQLSLLLFEMGAEEVYPGVSGGDNVPVRIENPDDAKKILATPLDPRNFWLSAGHLFGTCRMGRDAADSVVGTDFKVHGTEGLYIVDGSVLPTPTGVNPQHSIMSLARYAASSI